MPRSRAPIADGGRSLTNWAKDRLDVAEEGTKQEKARWGGPGVPPPRLHRYEGPGPAETQNLPPSPDPSGPPAWEYVPHWVLLDEATPMGLRFHKRRTPLELLRRLESPSRGPVESYRVGLSFMDTWRGCAPCQNLLAELFLFSPSQIIRLSCQSQRRSYF
jgi:hypothetical protein